jgi:ATP-dependent RNA helicase DDX54/DBP10
MKGQKRPIEDDDSDASIDSAVSEHEPDISIALTSKNVRNRNPDDDLSDEGLHALIQDAISERNVKSGTEVVKKAKGKEKLVKGEVGGGSFQSMGFVVLQKMTFSVAHPFLQVFIRGCCAR